MVNEQDERMRTSERGQSLVEFAFGLVVLLILLTGIVDATRALYTFLSMRDAAQEGALYGSLKPTDNAGIESRARGASEYMNGLGAEITVTPSLTVVGQPCNGITNGKPNGIKVAIDYPQFQLIMPVIGAVIGRQTVPISVDVTNSILQPKCSP